MPKANPFSYRLGVSASGISYKGSGKETPGKATDIGQTNTSEKIILRKKCTKTSEITRVGLKRDRVRHEIKEESDREKTLK